MHFRVSFFYGESSVFSSITVVEKAMAVVGEIFDPESQPLHEFSRSIEAFGAPVAHALIAEVT